MAEIEPAQMAQAINLPLKAPAWIAQWMAGIADTARGSRLLASALCLCSFDRIRRWRDLCAPA